MVGHQRIRKQSDLVGTTHLSQMIQYNLKILRCGEVELAIVAPRHHVHRPPGGIDARQTGHGDLKAGRSAPSLSP